MIVTISGNIGAGKDTLAKPLLERGFVRYSFAGAVKDNVARIFHWERTLLDGFTTESRKFRETVDTWWAHHLSIPDFTPRKVLQEYATGIMRRYFHPDVWMLSLRRELENEKRNVVITDCRFLNEFVALRSLGAVNIGVYREIDRNLKTFYTELDRRCMEVFKVPASQVDLTNVHKQATLVDLIGEVGKEHLSKNYHYTDLQHLVWPGYKAVIDNTKDGPGSGVKMLKVLGLC